MNILCLMGLFPEEYEAEILKNSVSGVQNAANKLQWAIVDGLNREDGGRVGCHQFSLYRFLSPKV